MEYTAPDIERELTYLLKSQYGHHPKEATVRQMYGSVLTFVNNLLLKKRGEFLDADKIFGQKHIYYLSMEFLVGTSLKNHLYNLGLMDDMKNALQNMGFSFSEIMDMEPDAGIGNGGLGRLASCYMDAATGMEYPIFGFSICYEFGIFKQKIVDGWQIEYPDNWLELGSYWLSPRPDEAVEVKFGGYVKEIWTSNGLKTKHMDYESVRAVPYDMLVSGYNSEAVNCLRLWRAESSDLFDMNEFSRGEYIKAMENNAKAGAISKVLYPADDHIEGKRLRLKQQYFFVSASLQNIVSSHLLTSDSLDNLPQKAVIQINDTHPSLCVPELMRILLDEHNYEWEKAWDITKNTLAYTNHTIMCEALEIWNTDLFSECLPRIYNIIKEIDRRFLLYAENSTAIRNDSIDNMRIIYQNNVRMANLCMIACFCVNGVSKLHTEILKNDTFSDFNILFPGKIINITNGIAYRRWLCESNPGLDNLICELIGEGFRSDLFELKKLIRFCDDDYVLQHLGDVKKKNKEYLAEYIAKNNGINIDSSAIFDVQVKRLHEYKRQLMNALYICHLYLQIKKQGKTVNPKVFIFGAKASPGYVMAKEIIRFICSLADLINYDSSVNDMIKVVFLEDYRVSIAEKIYPASEVSQQISLAGKEASGTGNMKMMLNGAITLGTLDGANIEIRDAVGDDNIFIFGHKAEEIGKILINGYKPFDIYKSQPFVCEVIDFIKNGGINGKRFDSVVDYLLYQDTFMSLLDFESYRLAQSEVNDVYTNTRAWNKKSLINIANSGIFSADRSINEYVKNVWYK